MTHDPEVLIVGGGVIGLSCAYALARDGRSVEVVDRGDIGAEASWAGAGIIPPGNPDGADLPHDRLRAISSRLFRTLSAELAERTGIDNGYRLCGGIEFLPHGDERPLAAWRAEGITYHELTEAGLRGVEPAVGSFPGTAHHLPGMAQVRNPRHLKALAAACRSLGVRLSPGTPVAEWERAGDRVVAVRLPDGGRRAAGQFLIAAGAWAEPLLADLGVRAGIHPVRGQLVLLRLPAPPFRPVLLVGKRYLVARDDGRVLVGATEEPEAGFDKRTTAEGVAGLVDFATGLVPSLVHAEVERAWAGLRPGSRDGLPCLGPVPGFRNAYVAAGHFRAGIQLSPGTALVMAECLAGRRPTLPLEPFRADREPVTGFTPAFRS